MCPVSDGCMSVCLVVSVSGGGGGGEGGEGRVLTGLVAVTLSLSLRVERGLRTSGNSLR